ncbi:MAG: quinone oxidoreductase family protein [Dongiaceae bacterium]
MRAVILEKFGGPEGLFDGTLPMPEVGPHDVLIRVKAVAFNPTDYQLRQAGHPALKPPVVLGRDVSGIVEACGDEVTALRPGDAVYSNLVPRSIGGYAEFVAIPNWFVAAKPNSLSFLEAASVPVTSLTALQSLRRARPAPSKSLLVAGGAGGVGSWAIGIAKAWGMTRIVTTAGSEASRTYLRDVLGIADSRIVSYADRNRTDLAAAAIAANDGRLFDITLDCVGGAITHLCCDTVEFEGDVVSIVNGPSDASHDAATADEDILFDKSATFHFELLSALVYCAPAARHTIYGDQLREVTAMIDGGKIRLPTIANLGPLSAAIVREAHRRLEAGHTIGKLAATVE